LCDEERSIILLFAGIYLVSLEVRRSTVMDAQDLDAGQGKAHQECIAEEDDV